MSSTAASDDEAAGGAASPRAHAAAADSVDRADPRGEILSGFDEIPFHRYLGLRLVERRDGYARLRLTRTASTPTGIGGSVNGGVIATMIDMATVPAVFTGMRDDVQPAGTADLQVTYLRQAQGAWIDAEATVIKRGRQLCTVEVSVTNDAGQLCARGRVLYALRPGPATSGAAG